MLRAMHAVSFPPPYEARPATESILFQTLNDHVDTFIYQREREFCPLPKLPSPWLAFASVSRSNAWINSKVLESLRSLVHMPFTPFCYIQAYSSLSGSF